MKETLDELMDDFENALAEANGGLEKMQTIFYKVCNILEDAEQEADHG
jgi:hypothetical protein